MGDVAGWRDVGSAARIFVLTFVGCLVGVPVFGLLLGVILSPVGLGWLAAGMYFPAFVLWLGSLRVGAWDGGGWLPDSDGYRIIPLVVWLVTWASFAWAARRLGGWRQVGAAAGVIVAVTVGMHVVLAVLGIRLVIDVL